MARLDTGTDDERVRVRPTKGSRPRTKRRPDYSARPLGRVVAVDRGRFTVSTSSGPLLQAVKAREIPRGAVVIGDFVRLTGDLSGRVDTLARIAHVEERTNVLRRSLEEAEDGRGEKIIVANTDLMVIVTALQTYAAAIGLAFQVQDDILDITGDTATLGKPQGSDLALEKSTYPALLGLDNARELARELHDKALTALQSLPYNTDILEAFADYIIERTH